MFGLWLDSVVLGDGAVNAEVYGPVLTGKPRQSMGALCAFDFDISGVNDVGHKKLLGELMMIPQKNTVGVQALATTRTGGVQDIIDRSFKY